MTLLSLKKRPTTALTIRAREIRTRVRVAKSGRLRLRAALASAVALTTSVAWLPTSCFAQQSMWQPSRIPASSGQQLSSQQATPPMSGLRSQPSASNATGTAENLGSGVVLRWKATATRTSDQASAPSASVTAQQAFKSEAIHDRPQFASSQASRAFDQPVVQAPRPTVSMTVQSARYTQSASASPAVRSAELRNPLRTSQVVPAANFQQTESPFENPFNDAPPALPQLGSPTDELPQLPGADDLAPRSLPQLDPLESPEAAPSPESILDSGRSNPFPSRGNDSSPADRIAPETVAPPKPLDGVDLEAGDGDRDALTLPKRRSDDANTISCSEARGRVKSLPLDDIDLDISPSFSEGLRSVDKDTEQDRLDFAASSEVRDWTNRKGMVIATGRLIDLANGRVVLDVDGAERQISLLELSDVDSAYVGEAWNLPLKCGIGYEPFVGRNFIASTVQWAASGACHKPLYFEQPQLERYGHETGPVWQPLISTAHFFGNIAILPYKMGIHPPNECQYSLGYIRPGNCAPYMVPAFPISLRGAATQAGFVTGAAALIP